MAGKIILILLIIMGFVSPGEDPFSGTWVLNLAKSKIPPPIQKSQTASVAVDGLDIDISMDIINNSGERLNISTKAKFDGRDYPVTGTPYADTVAYERVDRNTIKGIAKKDGKIVQRETLVVSADGKSLTGTYYIADATGEHITATAVFEKK
jgi:hypothetical protein